MQRKICEMCDRFYKTQDSNARFCEVCKEERLLCLEYLKTHPGASIVELTMATNIPIKKIRKMINDKLLKEV